jgi:SAM-dependent methyltransferase
MLTRLAELEPGSLGGVFCAHVVEHLQPPELVRFLELVAAALRPGGVFAAETPNPRTLVALGTFFADLTHERPLHPETLAFLVRQAGFRDVETRYLNAPPEEARLQPVPLPPGETWEPARRALADNTARLNEVVFGPQDYAVLARR